MISEGMQVKKVCKKKNKTDKYGEHKAVSMKLADIFEEIDPQKAERIRSCADLVSREEYTDLTVRYVAKHCCVRLCSVCSWKRSEKVMRQVFQVMEAVRQDFPDYRAIFVSFTQANCLPEDLDEELTKITKAFFLMIRTAAFKRAVKGFCRSIEITHNLKDGTYHPHIHAIFIVHYNYFRDNTYLHTLDWAAMWQKALRLNYLPNVDARKVKGNLAKAVAEISKYAVKSADFIVPDHWEFTVETVRLLNSVLHKRRFFAFGGLLKEYHKKLNLSDPDDPDEDKPQGAELVSVEHFAWCDAYRQYRPVQL